MIRTTVEALGGAQAVPSELIPARELHQHLINQVTTSGGNVVLAGTALGSAAPTPGGAVAVEAALTAGLVAAGVPVALALPAVLVHRAVTLWLRVPPGLLALVLLQRRGVL